MGVTRPIPEVGGGVVSSDEDESPSLLDAPEDESGGVGFIETRIDAASRSCTCWCLEIRSLEVYDHSGVCSHLQGANCVSQRGSSNIRFTETCVRPQGDPSHGCSKEPRETLHMRGEV